MPPNFRGLSGERNQFIRLRIRRGRIFERSGDAHRAVFHGFAHQSLHLIELLGSGLLVVVAEHHAADLRRADIAGEIDAHALLFEPREILAQGPPVGSDVVVVVARLRSDWMIASLSGAIELPSPVISEVIP